MDDDPAKTINDALLTMNSEFHSHTDMRDVKEAIDDINKTLALIYLQKNTIQHLIWWMRYIVARQRP